MEVVDHLEGATCWVDLATSDIEAASAFYADLLGWEITEGNLETGGYRQAMLHGRPVAGLMAVKALGGGLHGWLLALTGILSLLCASHLAVGVVNWLATKPRTAKSKP